MEQHKFKITQVRSDIMQTLQTEEATAYFAAMSFQLGCSIGELVAMGVPPEQVAAACDQFIGKAVSMRLSVNTKPENQGS